MAERFVNLADASARLVAAGIAHRLLDGRAIATDSGVRVCTDDTAFEVAFDPGAHPLLGFAYLTDALLSPAHVLVDSVRALEGAHTPFEAKWKLDPCSAMLKIEHHLAPPAPQALVELDASIDEISSTLPEGAVGDLRAGYEREVRSRFRSVAARAVHGEPGTDDEIGVDVDDWCFRATYGGATVRSIVDLRELVMGKSASVRGPGIAAAFLEVRIDGELVGVRINGFLDVEMVGTLFSSRGPRWIRSIYRREPEGWFAPVPLADEVSPAIPPGECERFDERIKAALEEASRDQFDRFVLVGLQQSDAWLERIGERIRWSTDHAHRRRLQAREREIFASRHAIEIAALTGEYRWLTLASSPPRRRAEARQRIDPMPEPRREPGEASVGP